MSDEVLVGAPVDKARQRLLAQVRRDGLHTAVAGAFADRDRLSAPGGPAARDQRFTVQTLPSYLSGVVTIIPLRWWTSSVVEGRLPAVDANLELQQAEPGSSRLGFTGIYRPLSGQATSIESDDARTIVGQFLGRLAHQLAVA